MPPARETPFPCRVLLGVEVSVADRAAALAFLVQRLAERRKTAIAFANTNLLTSAHRLGLAGELSRHFVIFNDGVGLDVVSALCHGAPFPENLNGTDFTADLLSAVPAGTRVFLYGARPDVVVRAAGALRRRHGVAISGACHGYVPAEAARELVGRINGAGTDIVLVALGNPRQERWIIEHRAALQAPLVLAVGAFLDFAAGAIPRAPGWVRAARLEWLFRLAREPSRLWRRYTVDGLVLARALLQARVEAGGQRAGQASK